MRRSAAIINRLANGMVKTFINALGARMQNFTNNTQQTVTVTVAGHSGSWIVAPGQTVQLPSGDIGIDGGGGPGEEQ